MQLVSSVCNIVFCCIGGLLILLGFVAILVFPEIHDPIISYVLKISPGSTAFVAWQKPKTPITMDIYFFNWTNPEDIYNSSIKPNFEEVGPYRFKQLKEKTNITWNPENDTITYQYLKNFYFDEENSPCHQDDIVTTINIVALSAARRIDDYHYLMKKTLSLSFITSSIYVRKTVRELLFDGYEDPILVAANNIPFISEGKGDKFGWFLGRNGSIGGDGAFTMALTQDDTFGTLTRWNYADRTPFYEGHCADIFGSAGELYHRHLKPDKIELFSPEMCRSVQFNFEANVNVKGIPGYKYSPGAEVFDNGTILEENACFCNGRCMPSGIMNVSACRENAPVFLSLPHFYYADPYYLEAVEGLNPIKEKHELYITLEPSTGIIADISARMQVNVYLQPMEDFALFDEVPEVMFPVFWFEQKVIMSDELVSGLTMLFNLVNTVRYASIVLIIIGIVFILSVYLYVICYKQRNRQHKLTREEIPLKSKS